MGGVLLEDREVLPYGNDIRKERILYGSIGRVMSWFVEAEGG